MNATLEQSFLKVVQKDGLEKMAKVVHLKPNTAIPRLVRTSLSALSLSAHQQTLTIPRLVCIPFSLSAHSVKQNWCNLTSIFG